MRNNRQERVLADTAPRGGSGAGIRRLKHWMAALLVVILLLVALLGVLVWQALRPQTGKNSASAVSDVSTVLQQEDVLPVPDDSWALTVVSPDKKISSSFTAQLTTYENVQVDKRILPALKKMLADAKAAGYTLQVTGGYVDADAQEKLYQQKIQELMQNKGKTRAVAESDAAAVVPPGGCSENQTGMAVTFPSDSAFLSSDGYHWLLNHCVEYGFVRRYTDGKEGRTGLQDDPSHFRYVGTNNAQTMRKMGLCLEEYVTYKGNQTVSN